MVVVYGRGASEVVSMYVYISLGFWASYSHMYPAHVRSTDTVIVTIFDFCQSCNGCSPNLEAPRSSFDAMTLIRKPRLNFDWREFSFDHVVESTLFPSHILHKG